MEKEKIYKIKTKDGYEDMKAIFYFGFDEDKLTQHPKEFNDKMTEILYMFVHMDSDFTWFEKNINTNPYISVMKFSGDINNINMDKLEKIVDKLIQQQNEALEYYFKQKMED